MRTFACLLIVLGMLPGIAAAQTFKSAEAEARLISATGDIGPEQASLRAGFQLKLAEGWKAYWRNPGEVGLAPELDWQTSVNVADVAMQWPAPKRFTAFGIENYGYGGEVVFPLDIALVRPGEATTLRADLSLLVCRELCIPVQAALGLDLAAGTGAIDPDAAQLIDRFRAAVPDDGTISGIFVEQTALEGDAVLVQASGTRPFLEPQVFLETEVPASWGPPEILASSAQRLIVRLPKLSGELSIGDAISVTITDGARAVTAENLTLEEQGSIDTGLLRASIWPFLLLAVLGGLILNAMPCVLPVLALKLSTVIEHRERSESQIRRGFIITSLGIIASMGVIAMATIAAKSAGLAVGWGLQFQNPYFLALMTLIVTLFAANLFDLFSISLPSALATGISGAGTGTGWTSDFATGAFATLLATPCSAPFLGTAVGFALSGGNLDIALIFACLGLGLAIPYIAVAVFPKTIRLLPRPGNWMNKLRLVMAVALLATALWLASVLWKITGPTPVILLGISIIAVVTLASAHSIRARLGNLPANIAASLLGGLAVITPLAAHEGGTTIRAETTYWQAFDPTAVTNLVSQGQTVLVDVTADWCITCKANKALVLDADPIAPLLQGGEIVAMQADWTRPNPEIAHYLERYGRYGIPFNIIYGPSAPDGIVLPELLSSSAVLEAIEQAGGASS